MRLRVSILVLFLALALTCFGQSQKVAYTYDDAYRLINVDYGNGKSIAYSYDKAGNLLSRTVTFAEQNAPQAAKTAKKKSKPSADKYQETRSARR